MNNFRIPPSPAWYTQPVCSPDNGLFYIAGNHTSIAYIPPIDQKDQKNGPNANDVDRNALNIQIIQTHNHFKSIACDPNWTSSKWFVTMNETNTIWVWNLQTEKICRGHKAHVDTGNGSHSGRHNDSDSQLGGAMCITKNRQVLSIDRNAFVRYCLASNTYSLFPDNFILKRGTVSLLQASPYDLDVIAVGYKNGLIVIANYGDATVLQNLRRHDSEIVSLQWTLLASESNGQTKSDSVEKDAKATPVEHVIPKVVIPSESPVPSEGPVSKETSVPKSTPSKNLHPKSTPSKLDARLKVSKSKFDNVPDRKHTRREAPKPIVDAGDMFDIHSYDYLEEEFGTISSHKSTWKETRSDTAAANANANTNQKSNTNNENFNFIEECQSLTEQIRAGNDSDGDDCGSNSNRSAVNMTDIRNMMAARGPMPNDSIDLPDDSVGSGELDEFSNRSTIGSSHNTTEIAELEDVIKDLNINENLVKEVDGTVYLASGAQESVVVIWNPQTGTIANHLQLKSHGRTKIPKSNCTIAWIRPDEFVVNGPDGKVSQWKVKSDEQSEKVSITSVDAEYSDLAVINICSNIEQSQCAPVVWTFSTHLNIVGHRFDDKSSEIIAKLSTLPIGMLTIRECPHDANKIAIAGNNKRISILDLSTLKENNVEVQSLTSKIQGKVLALAWHPVNENLLSFSTNEGRVGTFNISKTSSAPDLMMNFNGKDVYSLAYSIDTDTKKCTLYANNANKLMMFNESATKTDNHESISFPVAVSSVSVNDKFIAIGLSNGTLKILLNNKEKTEIYSDTLSKKYLSEMSWSSVNPDKLAVSSSDNSIFILENDANGFKASGKLVGHLAGVTFVKWSSQSDHKLVSASFDHTVRVWDTQTFECIAWSEYENKMFCAAFLPTDENFIVCSGQSETMHMFRIDDRLVANIGAHDGKNKKKTFTNDVQWGSLHQNDVSKLRAIEKKKLKKLEKKATETVDEITDRLNAVSVQGQSPVKLNHTTILYLTSKELNKDPLDHLQRLVQDASTSNDENADKTEKGHSLHVKLFGNREEVIELLNDELKNHKGSKTESIGNLLIPQINFELKSHIVQSIEEKRLTVQHVSLAPTISYEFWKNCSLAYANQCIDQGLVLQAIPHLLAVQQANEAIDKLCDAHFYREALCIAKMYKEPEEDVFESIATKWVKHLEQMGNLEGAALISFLAGKRDLSFEILNKRKSKTPQIEDILNVLSPKSSK